MYMPNIKSEFVSKNTLGIRTHLLSAWLLEIFVLATVGIKGRKTTDVM